MKWWLLNCDIYDYHTHTLEDQGDKFCSLCFRLHTFFSSKGTKNMNKLHFRQFSWNNILESAKINKVTLLKQLAHIAGMSCGACVRKTFLFFCQMSREKTLYNFCFCHYAGFKILDKIRLWTVEILAGPLAPYVHACQMSWVGCH